MKSRFVRGGLLALSLVLVPTVVAQKHRPPPIPDDPGSCSASGVRCLFGRSGGCTVTCGYGAPVCISARCILGFPLAAECYCDTPVHG